MVKKPTPTKTIARPPSVRSNRARAVADLVPGIGGQAFKRFGFTQSALIERWEEVVGASYARYSRPESLSFPRGQKTGGTLKIAVSGSLAPMLSHVEPQVIDRVNRLLGYAAVARITLRHADIDAPARFAAALPLVPLSTEVKSTLRDIADPELRASLESLAQALATSKGPPIIR